MPNYYLILDVDNTTTNSSLPFHNSCDISAPIKKLRLSPPIVDFANRCIEEDKHGKHYYLAGYICTGRGIACINEIARTDGGNKNGFLINIIKNMTDVTGLEFPEISTRDDLAIAFLGENYGLVSSPNCPSKKDYQSITLFK